MLRPDVLLAGEAAVSTRRKAGSDELLATQLAGLDRKIDAVAAERRRLADLYQASFIEREALLRRGKELELRSSALNAQRRALIDQREELTHQNRLRDRVEGFARRVQATIDQLDFAQRQTLLRLVIDEVRVSGWLVEIRFRIPLDNPPEPPNTRVSTKNRLRSLHDGWRRVPIRDSLDIVSPCDASFEIDEGSWLGGSESAIQERERSPESLPFRLRSFHALHADRAGSRQRKVAGVQ
ncbi:MAG: hypothetical protein WA864_13970 [Acetobacteraceae bacterium]